MGGGQSTPSVPKDVKNENEKSARNVLENIGKVIKDNASRDAKNYRSYLKGDLKKAKFYHPFAEHRPYYTGPCELEYEYHSNIWNGIKEYRHPCAGRNKNRFSNESEEECSSSKITGNKSGNGACAPYRRRHLCDYIFKQVNPDHINNSDDLLGNLLVTAKYEGESIVNSYTNSGTLNVCIGLARSFADIGDIIRGKDLYIGNGDYKKKVSNNLKTIFKKIYKQLTEKYKETETMYNDEEGNYLKLRETWWNANRDQIWKAITCAAGRNELYSKNLGNGTTTVSEGKCREVDENPSTNLDYVPQFLRWLEEWSEEFCRIRKIKIENIEKECRGKYDDGIKRYCSGDGHDCTKTDLSRNSIFVNLDCPRCRKECRKYDEWIENQENELNKQKHKYTKEIARLKDNSNNYDKIFYETLVKKYDSINSFLDALNEGSHCSYNAVEDKIDFNKVGETFTSSKFCKACPFYGVTCNKEKCADVKEDDYKKRKTLDSKDKKKHSTTIEVLVTHNRGKNIPADLKKVCEKSSFFKGIRNQKWKCEYKNEIDECKVDDFDKDIDVDDRISFKVLFERWLRNFIKDYNNAKDKINICVYNEDAKEKICIKKCKENCDCVEKWINKKGDEWGKIKNYYNTQYKSGEKSIVYGIKGFFEQGSFDTDYKKAQEVVEDKNQWKQLWGCIRGIECNTEATKSDKDFITNLISELKNKINSCKKQHEQTQENCCKTIPEITDDDEDDEDQEQTSPTPCGRGESSSTNPCVDKSSAKPTKTLTVVATEIQDEAHKKMVQNSGTDGSGESKLKGDISRGEFYKGRKVNYLKAKQICDITIEHSNVQRNKRAYNYAGPCTGKNQQRFNIGTEWSFKDNNTKRTHPEVYMPPRREHMCTSNLENLNLSSKGLIDSKHASHSLLGDVLLAAKKEGDFIVDRLNGDSDKSSICNAMKYSFADIGDIIRGKDFWVNNGDAKRLQDNLKTIFGTIHNSLSGNTKAKYKDKNVYLDLREDWWSANRDQVWKAMQCKIANGDFPCKSGSTPYDDYIPQRLRWMNEWAEWYCKAQNKYYGELKVCAGCKVDGKCAKRNGACAKCTTQCKKYGENVKKWEDQWNQIKDKYEELYKKSLENGTSVTSGGTKVATISKEDERVVEFLKKLHDGNKDKSNIYSSAAGYIHETADVNDCKIQTDFCKKKNGGKEDNVKYTFKEKPHDHDKACDCDKSTQKKDVCGIVHDTLNVKDGEKKINGCGSKIESTYPEWKCGVESLVNENDVCMPPRRQKLCVSSLTQKVNIKEKKDIRTEFIKSAATETHFAWHKYKKDNDKAENELKSGKIPDDFLRSMKYTFGDYRDIFFGTDISSCSNIKSTSNNIKDILNKEKKKHEEWWNEHGKEIWEGMLCAVTNDLTVAKEKNHIKSTYSYNELKSPTNGTPSLEEFSSRPQFLRWFTEWSDEFCKKQQKHYMDLEKGCKGCTVTTDGNCTQKGNCKDCSSQCTEYQNFITKWKVHWTQQSNKYKKLYAKSNDSSTAITDPIEKKLLEYIKELNDQNSNRYDTAGKYINKKGYINDCEKSKQTNFDKNSSGGIDEKYALRDYPNDHENKCNCKVKPPRSACEIVKSLFTSNNNFEDACSQKYKNGKEKHTQWYCKTDSPSTTPPSPSPTSTSTCIPPRRQQMYIKPLGDLGGSTTGVGVTTPLDLRKAFIESAAVETFFAWHKFKKDKEREREERKKEYEEIYGGFILQDDEDEEDPQTILKKGKIPDEFKRQMFYTFGDYRDLCLGNDIAKTADTTGISHKVKSILSGKSPKGQECETWWNTNDRAIWEGMVYALSYNTNDKKVIEGLCDILIKPENKNMYDDVKINSVPNVDTKLTDFARRDTFFRWFEEWNVQFCRKRKRKIDKIKHECRSDKRGHQYCSADGYDCTVQNSTYNNMFTSLNCRQCHEECANFKKWIKIKKNEFDKQKKQYEMEIPKLKDNSINNSHDQKFYNYIKVNSSVQNFFESLKKGKVCEDNNDEHNEIDFNNNKKTFGPSTYCKACPLNGVNCSGNSQCIPKNKIKETNPKAEQTDINILIEDEATDDTDDLEGKCSQYGLYKDLRKQRWKCQYVNQIDQCNIENVESKYFDEKIPFNVLLERWTKDFIEYYNKSKAQISSCIKNQDIGDHKCIQGCKDNCDCVEKWLEVKAKEWEEIKEYYNNQTNRYEYNIAYKVKSIFEQQPFEKYGEDAKKIVENPNEREELWGNTGRNYNNRQHTQTNDDFITNLIKRLKDKIKTCQNEHNPSDETKRPCDPFPPQAYIEPLDPDSPEYHHHTEQPNFCPPPPPPMTCVERAAKQLREEAEKNVINIDSSLKGNGTTFNGECNKVKKNDTATNEEDSCKFEKTYETSVKSLRETCRDNRNERFIIGKEWKCVNIYKIGKDLCIPPRREHMCLYDFKTLWSSNINDSTDLLKKFQEVAKSEGDDIIKNLLPQNTCNENVICDAMKYSFADLGDIIRGRDLLRHDGDERRIQRRLINVFTKIYSKLDFSKQMKYQNDITNLYDLRSDWWDANRKHIWNAMICNAPDDAKFLKKDKNFNSGTSASNGILLADKKCGNTSEPPDYDYIPQTFRWMQEWSEYYCKLLNKELDNFKNQCSDCQGSSSICTTDIEKCTKCKEQCKKYKELIDQWKKQFGKYEEIYNNNDSSKTKEYVKKFLETLKRQCEDVKTADKYLHEATQCTDYGFRESDRNDEKYAFKNPPKGYKEICECETPDPLNDCPNDNKHLTVCKNLFPTKFCESKTFNNDVDTWTSSFVKKSSGKYTRVLVPPRRRELCIKNITTRLRSIEKNKELFKTELMNSAYNEGKLLGEKYDKDKENVFQAMKYSFYDYGDIVKGTDLISTPTLDKLKTKLNVLLKEDGDNKVDDDRGKWWANNKRQIWHAILCGYKAAHGNLEESDCVIRDDNTPQFFRWFREWSEHFCSRRQKLYDEVQQECTSAICDSTNGIINPADCERACTKYKTYITKKREEYRIIMNQYNMNFKDMNDKGINAPEYYKETHQNIFQCLLQHIHKEQEWKNIYDSFGNNELKNKCVCKKIKTKSHPKEVQPEEEHADAESDLIPAPEKPPVHPKPDELPPPTPSTDNTSDILSTTIPVGIALALGSIAFLFMKKKSKSSVDLLRVVNIPKGEYEMPTLKSKNRYIPYRSGSYKGKTYIYMEGDTSGDEDKYIWDLSSSDITSSESEYEEMDINDIYVPGSPKYKTLIEVVLEPSKSNGNTLGDDMVPTTNTFTDEEWNELKHDFISQYLPNTEPNNNYTSGDIPMNTEPNTLYFDKPEEKPFITSIHDRDLYTGEEINYNINMVNNDIPISARNDSYSGIDLINDSLSGGEPIDIYDELLKRKENELFGTKHPKRTSNNSVAKNTNNDPIMNQLDLLHKWLDRHRDMCEQWNNKEDILKKLNEECNKDNDGGNVPIDNRSLNTDVSIQIDMDHGKPKKEFTNMDTNVDTPTMNSILDDLETYNEPFYDIYEDDVYYDVNDDNKTSTDHNNLDVSSKVQIEMDVNSKLVKEKYPISDVWDI
ncbi:erythrocyte membrane protein 1, PfEMP1, putative [Plasmodium sp.]|nr:erythrocyte membrane protein 1, PfEMP1, putative [Plasmodium sp.]